jgi:hypothetical protein
MIYSARFVVAISPALIHTSEKAVRKHHHFTHLHAISPPNVATRMNSAIAERAYPVLWTFSVR